MNAEGIVLFSYQSRSFSLKPLIISIGAAIHQNSQVLNRSQIVTLLIFSNAVRISVSSTSSYVVHPSFLKHILLRAADW